MVQPHLNRGSQRTLAAAFCASMAMLHGCTAGADASAQSSAPGQSSSATAGNTSWSPGQAKDKRKGKQIDAGRSDDEDAGKTAVDTIAPPTATATATADAGAAQSGSGGMAAANVAGAAGGTRAAGAAGVSATMPTMPTMTTTTTAAPGCSRDALQQSLKAYLDAMSLGDPETLPLDPNVYYTENGQEQTFGAGLWLSRPKAEFTRSALDSEKCGSVTEAVLIDRSGTKIIYSVRLRYVDELLVDVEAMIIRPDPTVFAPDAIVVAPPDPWIAEIPIAKRMSRDALLAVAMSFFESIVLPTSAPPHAPTCKLRQNGVEVGSGHCVPGDTAERFKELRYPVVDETTGIVGGVGLGMNFLVMFLIKVEDGTLINIDNVGGKASAKSGW